MDEARGKPSFLRWRSKIDNAKGTEDVEERTYSYGGCKFVWGGDNQAEEERRLLSRIITVTNNNSKKREKINDGDADDKLETAPIKTRRRLEHDEALPLVGRLPAYIKWQALGEGGRIEYKKRIYVKGVHGMEEKLMTAMANSLKIKEKVRRGSGGGGGGGGSGKGHDAENHTSNKIPPAINQNELYIVPDATNSFIKLNRQRVLEVRATKIRDARKRYFERNGRWEGAQPGLSALEGIDSFMKRDGGMGRDGEEEVVKDEAGRTLDNFGVMESPDLIAIVDALFNVIDINNMTTKSFYRIVGDSVGRHRLNKKMKGAIKERITSLMEDKRRNDRSKDATATVKKEEKKIGDIEKMGSRFIVTRRHDMDWEEVGGIDTEDDEAVEVPTTSIPHCFYVGQLVNVIEGK